MTHTVGGRTVKSTSRKFLGGVVRTIGEVVATSATHVTQDVLFNDLDNPYQDLGYRGVIACKAAGITYRQLDYWARTGLIKKDQTKL